MVSDCGRLIEHRKLHPAGDVDADGVRNDRVLASQHAADRQAVADVCVRHQRGADGVRHLAGHAHLLVGGRVDVVAPGAVGDRLASDWRFVGHQFAGEFAPDGVGFVSARVLDDGGNKLSRPLSFEPHAGALFGGFREGLNRRLRAIRRHPEFVKLFGFMT